MTIYTKYSPTGHIKWLQQLLGERLIGDVLLLLAHDVLEHPTEYFKFVRELRNLFPAFIILDNSVVELGEAIKPEEMAEACKIVHPNCVVLPDVLGDSISSCCASHDGYLAYKASNIDCDFMAVVQGNSYAELQYSIIILQASVNPKYWGLPRIVANTVGTRKVFTRMLGLDIPELEPRAHLLGMSKNLEDDIVCAKLPGVMSIDSANPLILGQQQQSIELDAWKHVTREPYWSQPELSQCALNNVRYMWRLLD